MSHPTPRAGLIASFAATWRAILADKAVLMVLFVGGLVYSFFYPLPYANEVVEQVPVAIVDQDHSGLSRQIARFVAASPAVRVQAVTADLDAAQDLLWRNQIAGVLHIPSGLQAQVLAGRRTEVGVMGNGVYLMRSRAALNGMAQAVGTVSAGIELKRLGAATPSAEQARALRAPLGLNAVALFNVREGYGAYLVPAVAVLLIQQTLLMGAALLMGTWIEDEQRTHLPHTLRTYLGMWLALATVPFLNGLYYFGFVFWWQGYPRGGNLPGMLLFNALYAGTLAAVAMWLGTWFRTRERSMQLLICTAMPMLFLSGVSWPVEAMPPALQWLRWALPSTAGIQGFIALNQLGASLAEVRTEALVLLTLGAIAFGLGLPRWMRRPH